jgi:hypothetical protein
MGQFKLKIEELAEKHLNNILSQAIKPALKKSKKFS